MNSLRPLFVFLITLNSALAQQPVDFAFIDKKSSQIPDSVTKNSADIAQFIRSNFSTDADKIRAAFYLTTHLIDYDISLVNSGYSGGSKEENIAFCLRNKKGVCQHYAELFSDLCMKSGIKAMVVEGYTKQKGKSNYTAHAWCMAYVDHSWQLFDPTWSAGYLENLKYIRRFNEHYYAIDAAEMVMTHLPYDPMMELLKKPFTRDDFELEKLPTPSNKKEFNFLDSLSTYESLTQLEKLEKQYLRIKNNGTQNRLAKLRLGYLKQEMDVINQNEFASNFNAAVRQFNAGINGYNRFIAFRKNHFLPLKPDAEIKAMLDSSAHQLKQAIQNLTTLQTKDHSIQKTVKELIHSAQKSLAELEEQNRFLRKYFSCDVNRRKTMF